MPQTVPAPCLAGKLVGEWHHIPAEVPVGVAMGDLQCSVCAAMPEPGDAGEHVMEVFGGLRILTSTCHHYS